MRSVNLTLSRPCAGQEALLARLTRHLEARLLDFGPGGPEVLSSDQASGTIRARFPGHEVARVQEDLARQGVLVENVCGEAVFHLSPDIPFEDLDYVWGCLNALLG